MLYQGVFNIIDLYFNEIDLFYDNLDMYFRDLIDKACGSILIEKVKPMLLKGCNEIRLVLKDRLIELGFEEKEVEIELMDQFLDIKEEEVDNINSAIDLYEQKIAPFIYEIFLEEVINFIVDIKDSSVLLTLKDEKILPIEFIVELRELKNIFQNDSDKKENLRKYIQIEEKIIDKFRENKFKIEKLENLEDPQDKLQLLYLIFRIIDFFNLGKRFDFSNLREYLKNNMDEWLTTIPLVSLRNPDLYFCGIYLADRLEIELDSERVNKFLCNVYDEINEEFEAPIIEATDRVYYYFKSITIRGMKLPDEKIIHIMRGEQKFFRPQYLQNLETSQLVVILKIFKLVNAIQKTPDYINASLIDEINLRITKEGIVQHRDGFISSEATYYVLFCGYMRNSLKILRDYDLVGTIISRIYRNLEILDFSKDTNYDLVSEIFYSCESLKLLNCIETKEMIMKLATKLFPEEVVEKIVISKNIARGEPRFRHLKVNKITGETIY